MGSEDGASVEIVDGYELGLPVVSPNSHVVGGCCCECPM